MSERYKVAEDFSVDEWLGGLLELTGSFYFSHPSTHPYPVVRICTNDMRWLKKFCKITDAGDLPLYPTGKSGSKVLLFTHDRAVDLVDKIQKYTPSRSLVINYFDWWSDARGLKEKLLVSDEYTKAKSNNQQNSMDIYLELLKSPSFFAGLIDGRGKFRHDRYGTNVKDSNMIKIIDTHSLVIRTSNVALLNAIREIYLGNGPYKERGTHSWTARSVDLDNLVQILGNYLQLKHPLP